MSSTFVFSLAGTFGGKSATMYCLQLRNVEIDSQLLSDPVKYVHLCVNIHCMYVHVCMIEGCVRELSITATVLLIVQYLDTSM